MTWILIHGSIPMGLGVLHTCDNPPCCRPDHLWLGTVQDNVADKVKKGRMAKGETHGSKTHPESIKRGENHHSAKFSDEIVRQIRERYMPKYGNGAILAKEFGISSQHLCAIIKGKARK